LDGKIFATGRFPPDMHPQTHVSTVFLRNHSPLIGGHLQAYTILESSTDAIFMLMTMSEPPHPFWGNILKSNSNGTYFGLSIANVNRDVRGLVDFEKMIGLDGIALINIVANTEEAIITREKRLQTRITHNDGEFFSSLRCSALADFGYR
jgi:Sortilin, neurotensin receptor 3,